jgi:hypothetical protein
MTTTHVLRSAPGSPLRLEFRPERDLVRATLLQCNNVEQAWGLMHPIDARLLAREYKIKWPRYCWERRTR